MRHSIKRQMMAVFVGLAAAMMAVLLIMNGGFLERYYAGRRQHEFVRVYQLLEEKAEAGDGMEEQAENDLDQRLERNNISILVVDPEYNTVYMNGRDGRVLLNQMVGYLFNKTESKILKRGEEYIISTSRDPVSDTEYMEMWGTLSNRDIFLMRSPMDSIRSAVSLFNRFIAVVGAISVAVGFVLALYFSRKLTEPILELAALSQKMANLDFEAKYTSGGDDEIGVLGENFNQMSEKLEQTITDLKQANHELQKDIEQKEKINTMRSEFLGNVSHELKTPIALIQGYAEGLKEGVNTDPESRDFYCDVIMDEAAKMNQLVRSLLTLNQLEFGADDTQLGRFDIAALIRGVLDSSEILIDQKQVRLLYRQEEPVYVWADEFKVEQVLRNYLSNALNHVDGERVVEIKITPRGDQAVISVFNTGAPIPEEALEHIWDKFYKVDKAHTREYGGNGIGLSIVKAIMESFHKDYGVRNYGNGVEFWFMLDMK